MVMRLFAPDEPLPIHLHRVDCFNYTTETA